jgi:hypothetical protein
LQDVDFSACCAGRRGSTAILKRTSYWSDGAKAI